MNQKTKNQEDAMEDYATYPERRTVRVERILPGPIEKVWAYLYEPEKRAQWFAGGPIEPKVGGKADLAFHHPNITDEPTPEKFKAHCENKISHERVTHYDPPRLLGYTFGGGDSHVTFELTPQGDKVRLVITQVKLASREELAGNSGGWHLHADLLVNLLNNRPKGPFWSKVDALNKEYAKRAPA
jgi:uncharacterized protein YndB with AHSA1/START domain